MRKIHLIGIVIFVLFLTSSVFVNAAKQVDLVLVYGQGCPHCAKEELFLEKMQEKYPSLIIHKFEVYNNQSNRELAARLAKAYKGSFAGVPLTFIGDKMFLGYSNEIGKKIENKIKNCMDIVCINPLEKLNDSKTEKTIERLTLPIVISAAAVDAINPCAFAVLIILLTTILIAKNRKKVILAGLAFSSSIYLSYFLMGIGIYSAVRASGITHIFYTIVAILAILVGLFNLKDYLWYGKWFVMEVPRSWRPRLKLLIKSVTSVPGAFLIGFIVSLFLLPCTSGPYIVILGLLAKAATRNIALMYLLLYNFIFILPMLIITFVIGFGFTTTEEAEEWRQKKLKILHLIAGIIILLIGIAMLVALMLGMV